MSSPNSRPAAGTRSGIAPNFDRVPPGPTMEAFCQEVHRCINQPHYHTRGYGGFRDDLQALNAMNTGLAYGSLDSRLLASILWRNRSMQEFFTAVWLARYCDDQDVQRLRDWIYLPDDPVSDEYYWVWRFATEMPPEGRQGQAWVRAMSPLYAPGDGTWNTKRSNEMIYRSWTARRFVRSFITLPAGEFQMGSAEGKGDLPDDEVRQFRPKGPEWSRQEEQLLTEAFWDQLWRYTFRLTTTKDGHLESTFRLFYPRDETPERRCQQVAGFRLSHSPTLNGWYRLYDPGNRPRWAEQGDVYARISGQSDTPVISVSWYDAWAFCLWAHWDGESCRLPQEHEWEYAAKAGSPWDWDYWWGDDFDPGKCNAERRVGRTTAPSRAHANPWGFRDILGNVWEWCLNGYRKQYAVPPQQGFRPRVAWRLVGQRRVQRSFRVPRFRYSREPWGQHRFSRGQGSTKNLTSSSLPIRQRARERVSLEHPASRYTNCLVFRSHSYWPAADITPHSGAFRNTVAIPHATK